MWLKSYFRERSLREDVTKQKDIIKKETGFDVDRLGRLYKVIFVEENQQPEIVLGMHLNALSEDIKKMYPGGYPLNGFNVIPEFVNLEAVHGPTAHNSYLCIVNPVADTETYIITPTVEIIMKIINVLVIVSAISLASILVYKYLF